MLLIQGIMSAISAGMLMYAACVEMLAGDFVMDPILWRSGLWKQALALLSLSAGVVAMALVGS
jgi:zinc transporter 1/2/3